MRVAFVTQWWRQTPEGVIAGIVESLQGEGAEVGILAGRGGLDGAYDGPRWPLRYRDRWRSAPVTTYPYYHSHDGSAARRLLTYGTFSATSAIASSDLRSYDVALVYGSPVTAAASAMVAQRRYGLPYVLHVQDVWPDSIFATGFLTGGVARRTAEKAVGAFVDSAYRRAAAVVGISPGMRDLLVSRGVPPAKAHYVYNWVSDDVPPVEVPERRDSEPLHLMYAGSLGFAQDLTNVLDAVALLPRDSVRLSLVGSGPAEATLRRRASELGLANVSFVERVPRAQVPGLQSTAHLHLISLADQELFRITIPSKLQALAASGAPILCSAPGEVAQIVTSNQLGVAAHPGDPRALAATIQHAARLSASDLRLMGKNGRHLYDHAMARSIGAARLTGILRAAADSRRPRRYAGAPSSSAATSVSNPNEPGS